MNKVSSTIKKKNSTTTTTDLSQHPCFMNKKTEIQSSETTKPRSDTKSGSVTTRPQVQREILHIWSIPNIANSPTRQNLCVIAKSIQAARWWSLVDMCREAKNLTH